MNNKQIKRLEKGLSQYQYLRQELYKVDVSKDSEFQRVFNGFFRVRQRKQAFYTDFYRYLEQHKQGNISFEDALRFLYERHGRIELSFVSKMVALINPSCPIWDSVVAEEHFGLKKPYTYEKNRFEKTIEKYYKYCQQFAEYMQTEVAAEKIKVFNRYFPLAEITDVKKVDFILWQDR